MKTLYQCSDQECAMHEFKYNVEFKNRLMNYSTTPESEYYKCLNRAKRKSIKSEKTNQIYLIPTNLSSKRYILKIED